MKLATWNVNSIRSRLDRLIAWLGKHRPDVLCLQELKCQDFQFPYEAIEAAGYYAAVFGQKAYNGVAILSRSEPADVRQGLGDGVDDSQARLISADIDGVRVICVYIPNGAELHSEKYLYKIDWLGRLGEMLGRDFCPEQPLILCGDSNVLIHDRDAANPATWRRTGIGCDEVRDAFGNVRDWGLIDVFGRKHPKGGIYSWWDYRQLSFAMNNGMRIDHILATAPLAQRCTSAEIDRDERKGQKPSDHAPVVTIFE
ncbi:MAG: exodeoxyribonuclease III [Phycisphaerae bacterium]|nr:exodeoxyribonuclease III [Phycisphaerae bacterium]